MTMRMMQMIQQTMQTMQMMTFTDDVDVDEDDLADNVDRAWMHVRDNATGPCVCACAVPVQCAGVCAVC